MPADHDLAEEKNEPEYRPRHHRRRGTQNPASRQTTLPHLKQQVACQNSRHPSFFKIQFRPVVQTFIGGYISQYANNLKGIILYYPDALFRSRTFISIPLRKDGADVCIVVSGTQHGGDCTPSHFRGWCLL